MLLAEVLRRKASDPEACPDWFHSKQRKGWDSTAAILAIIAGWQSGKTVFLPPWLKREIRRKGPGDYGAFSSTFKLLDRKFLPELTKEFSGFAEYRASVGQFRFTEEGSRRLWGSGWSGDPTIIQLGHAENPDSLESSTLKAVVWDEPGQRLVPQQSFNTVRSRLTVNRGRLVLATRPYEPGWMEQLVRDALANPGGEVEVINFPSWENPSQYPEDDPYWEAERARLPAWQFKMYWEGLYTRPAGVIYDCFDYNLDTCDDKPIPPEWKRYPCMDFGSVNAAGLVIAEDPHSKELFVFHEYLSPGKRKMHEHAAELRKAGALSVGAGGNKSNEEGWRDSAAACGIWLDELDVNNAEVQIQCVYEQIALHNLKFFRKACVGTISDLENFAREIDDNGLVTDKIAGHEPHRLAALRYGITKLRPPKKICLEAPSHTPRPGAPTQDVNQPARRNWDLTGRFARG